MLYDYYVTHYGWDIPENNPSGLKVINTLQKPCLTDFYDEKGIFFSIKDLCGECICSARLCGTDEDKILDLENYPSAVSALSPILQEKTKTKLVELNREAIRLDYVKDKKVYLMLLLNIFIYCEEHGFSLITTTILKEWCDIYTSIGFFEKENLKFKYFSTELIPVNVYHASLEEVIEIKNTIKLLLEKAW